MEFSCDEHRESEDAGRSESVIMPCEASGASGAGAELAQEESPGLRKRMRR